MNTKTYIDKQKFKKDWRLFFKKAVQRRSWLLNAGKSMKSERKMRYLVDYFTPFIDYQFTTIATAIFIEKHKDQFQDILVNGNILVEARFTMFLEESDFILRNQS